MQAMTVEKRPGDIPAGSESFRSDYTKLAEDYDALRFEGTGGRLNAKADARIIDEFITLAGASRVLDVPTGTGRIFDYLAHRNVEIIGCDLTQAMLDKAAARKSTKRPVLIRGDASDLPFPAGTIECITCLRLFHLVPHDARSRITFEFARVLQPGGHIICSFTNGWYGGGINWITNRADRPFYFLRAGEIGGLFPGFRVLAVRGNFWPLQRYASSLGPAIESWSLRLNSVFPFNRLCWEVFYLLQKPV
jgi:ubiquinone/menaquinone biosynthesis C-methylase UbiE